MRRFPLPDGTVRDPGFDREQEKTQLSCRSFPTLVDRTTWRRQV